MRPTAVRAIWTLPPRLLQAKDYAAPSRSKLVLTPVRTGRSQPATLVVLILLVLLLVVLAVVAIVLALLLLVQLLRMIAFAAAVVRALAHPMTRMVGVLDARRLLARGQDQPSRGLVQTVFPEKPWSWVTTRASTSKDRSVLRSCLRHSRRDGD